MKQQLPGFDRMWYHYPRGAAADVKKGIGGKVNYDWIVNTCAIRLSRALNLADHAIPGPGNPHGLNVISGADGKWYAFRVRELKDYLIATFGRPSVSFRGGSEADRRQVVAGKKGIIVFHVSMWNDATGHITLWDGIQCPDNDCYFDKADAVELWVAP